MTAKNLSCPMTTVPVPVGTVDPGFTFTVTGTLADGTAFSQTQTSAETFVGFDLQPGTYVGVVSKLTFSSMPSVPLVVTVPTTISLTVPDVSQAAFFA